MILLAASTNYVDWSSMWKILVIALIAGAGLVSVYSISLVTLSMSGYLHISEDGTPTRHNPLALAAGLLCLAVVVAGAAYGIDVMFSKG